ncbi:MAG: elongation factor Ts [Clostridia bacterium]|nr:elongation factor Ts [Oscillospiraceae bacterium]MBR6747889.1 elongation factor Ts [Clostridia bacterium]
MAITAKDIQRLREMTGVGMMDCKKALTQADGDFDKAIEFLREKGLAQAQKKASRIAAEGVVHAEVCNCCNTAAIVEVNCETDFVAKNPDFQAFTAELARVIIKNKPADVDALMNVTFNEKFTVAEAVQDKVLTIGENIKIRRFHIFEGTSVSYIHAGGKIGVLVNLDTDLKPEQVNECGKDIAMQIAALNPRFWDKSQVTADVLDEERKIMLAQMANDPKMANKPEQVLAKIVDGKLNKFYSENCLLQQEFVKDGEYTVEKYIAKCAKELGGSIVLKDAIRFEKGEGLAKREDNFAEEIAKLTK